jgi:hypothetical protein
MLDSASSHKNNCLVFMPARNCEIYAAEAIRSVARQTHEDVHVLYVDDGSEDQTGEIAQHYLTELFPARHTYVHNPARLGKSQNIWAHLRPLAAGFDFIAILDADDQLADSNILREMATHYAAGKDVVWTNFFTDSGRQGQNSALDPTCSPRKQRWCTSHFFSFRSVLLENIPESYYKDGKGDWYMGACDVALALPVLDQTRNYKFIPKLAYRYTMTNPLSLHNSTPKLNALTSKLQHTNALEIHAKPPLPLYQPRSPLPAPPADSAPPVSSVSGDIKLSEVPSIDPAQVWHPQAARQLGTQHPDLLSALAVTADSGTTPLQLLSLSRIISRHAGRVLYIGAPETATLVVALAAEASVTCLMAGPRDEQALRARLALLGLDRTVEILAAPKSKVQFNNQDCLFPSCAALSETAPFDVVIVDARAEENEGTFAVVALPAISEYLSQSGFHFCTLLSRNEVAAQVIEQTAKLTVGLEQCLGGIGGTGIVTFPVAKD